MRGVILPIANLSITHSVKGSLGANHPHAAKATEELVAATMYILKLKVKDSGRSNGGAFEPDSKLSP